MNRNDFEALTPDKLFIFLTGSVLYEAVRLGNWQKIDAVLSCFDADARQCLCVGLASLRAMGDKEYRSALCSAMAETLYKYYKEAKQ